MLGKLLKHECRETAKLLIPLDLIVLALTAVWAILLGTGIFNSKQLNVLSATFVLLYVLSIIALFILTAVYLMMRFYKSMYSGRGYLTHTLPASSSSILNSKILSAMAFIILALIVCIASVLILIFSVAGLPDSALLYALKHEISVVFGMGFAPAVCTIIACILIYCFSSIMMIYASLSIGQLFNQSLFILGLNALEIDSNAQAGLAELPAFYHNILLLGLILGLLFGIAYYIICHIIIKKKLNLE